MKRTSIAWAPSVRRGFENQISAAAAFGEPQAIQVLGGNEVPCVAMMRAAAAAAQRIDPDDFIICIGDIVLLGITVAKAMELNATVNLLRWDNNVKAYALMSIDENDWDRKDDDELFPRA